MDGVAKFGITTPAQLAQQKALIRGRIATGYMTVGAAPTHWRPTVTGRNGGGREGRAVGGVPVARRQHQPRTGFQNLLAL